MSLAAATRGGRGPSVASLVVRGCPLSLLRYSVIIRFSNTVRHSSTGPDPKSLSSRNYIQVRSIYDYITFFVYFLDTYGSAYAIRIPEIDGKAVSKQK